MSYEQQMKMASEQQMRAMQNAYSEQLGALGQANLKPRVVSPIESELNGLGEMLHVLHKQFSVIESKLAPVLVTVPEDPSKVQPCPPMTGVPLADQLHEMLDRATALRNRMEALQSRVAL